MQNNKLLIIGKNSNVYGAIESYLPSHNAISHQDVYAENLSAYSSVVLLSFPKTNDHIDNYLDLLDFVIENSDNVIYISTFGLNGVNNVVREKYFYLRYKRLCEIKVLKSGGLVLRLGEFVIHEKQHSGFITTPKQLANAINVKVENKICNIGDFTPIKLTLFKALIAKLLGIVNRPGFSLLFIVIHIITFFSHFRGYTLFSNYVLSRKCSVGAGLSSLTAIQNTDISFIVTPPQPVAHDVVSTTKTYSYSTKTSGFGSRWHGVSSLITEKITNGFSHASLSIPLVPPGRFLLAYNKIVMPKYTLLVQKYLEKDGFIELIGLDEGGNIESVCFSAAILNVGVYQTLKIISHSLVGDMKCNIHKQILCSAYPVRLGASVTALSKPGFFCHHKYGYHIKTPNFSSLLYFRPKYHRAIEKQLVYGTSSLGKVFAALSNVSMSLLEWVIYSKFGYLKHKDDYQLDIQLMVTKQVSVSDQKSLKSDIDDVVPLIRKTLYLANEAGIILNPTDAVVNSELLDALHLTASDLEGIELIGVDEVKQGAVMIGSVGRLLKRSDALHNSSELLKFALFEITR